MRGEGRETFGFLLHFVACYRLMQQVLIFLVSVRFGSAKGGRSKVCLAFQDKSKSDGQKFWLSD